METAVPIPSQPDDRIDVRRAFPAIAATISVTGAMSNAGKTRLCEALIAGCAASGAPSFALKVTRTHLGACPRGVTTCGTCDSLSGLFEIVATPGRLAVRGKDTDRYLRAGASIVRWLLVKPSSVRAGVAAALALVPPGATLIAEGNSFRDYASADVSFMALARDSELKPSAHTVLDRIDAFVALPAEHAIVERRLRAIMGDRPLLSPADAWPWAQGRVAAAGPGACRPR